MPEEPTGDAGEAPSRPEIRIVDAKARRHRPASLADRCPVCGNRLLEGDKFCGRCGAPIPRACAKCGAALRSEDRFCGRCGTAAD